MGGGGRLIELQSQNKTIAANMIAEKKVAAIRTPVQVRAHDDHLAVVNMFRAFGMFPCQQQVVGLHDPVNPLVVDRRQAL